MGIPSDFSYELLASDIASAALPEVARDSIHRRDDVPEVLSMLNKPIVYIVEDDPQVRELLRQVVGGMGLEVEVADSAETFLAQFDPARPSCLVLDVCLPGTSGLQLLEHLRRQQREFAAILISGNATVADAVQAMKWGAIDFLEKPYSLAALRDAIRRALGRQHLQREQAAKQRELLQRFSRLTADERIVARLTAAGESDKRIAAQTDVSTRTVQLRRACAMRKLDIESRMDLVRFVESLSADVWEHKVDLPHSTTTRRTSSPSVPMIDR